MGTTPEQVAALPSVQALQEQLREVQTRHAGWQHAQQLMAAQLAPQFSPFSVYRSNEVDVSRHLLLLLDPKGTHGQGSLFWDAWVAQVLDAYQEQSTQDEVAKTHGVDTGVGSDETQAALDWLRASKVKSVETEMPTSEGRFIDLYARTQHGILGIENKPWVWSKDGVSQLKDYAKHLSEAAGNAPWALVYLAHNLPSQESWPEEERLAAQRKGQFVYVPWLRLVAALQACVRNIQAPKVRWFVEDLIVMMEKAMGYTDNAQMQHIAQAFTHSPQLLSQAFVLRDTLKQWQVSQLTKLEGLLKKRCDALGIAVDWQVSPDNPAKKYAHFALKFEQHPQVNFQVEWYTTLNDESSVYWGLIVKGMPANKAREMYAALSKVCHEWPCTERTEANWPYWVYLGNDPLFAPDAESPGADIEHPWLSMDYEGERNFVELVLQRYEQARAALADEKIQQLLSAKP